MNNILAEIHAILNGELRNDGEYHVNCPYCGKPAKRGDIHFSYGENGCHCFVCGKGAGLVGLAKHLKLEMYGYTAPRHKPKKREPPPVYSDRLLHSYELARNKYPEWHEYRGILPGTVDKFRLGYGKLPGEKYRYTPTGLILPVFDARGRCRTLRCRTQKGWLTAGGKTLYAPVGVPQGATVIIVENCANCCLIAQAAPWLTPLAPTTGAASWDRRWVDRLVATRPALVIVAGDDDEAGHHMNTRWSLALEIAGVPVRTEIFNEERERRLMNNGA